MQALAGYPVPVLSSAICQRVAFAESAAQGKTVMEMDPTSTASCEIHALLDEIIEWTRRTT